MLAPMPAETHADAAPFARTARIRTFTFAVETIPSIYTCVEMPERPPLSIHGETLPPTCAPSAQRLPAEKAEERLQRIGQRWNQSWIESALDISIPEGPSAS